MTNRKLSVCVIGAWRNYSVRAEDEARKLGRWVAENGHRLIHGACLGIPMLAGRACIECGGEATGYSPANAPKLHIKANGLTLQGSSDIIYMDSDQPLSYAERNIRTISSADMVVLISGRMGAVNEFTIAHDQEKAVGVIEGVGGASDMVKALEIEFYGCAKSIFSSDIPSLMPELESLWRQGKSEVPVHTYRVKK